MTEEVGNAEESRVKTKVVRKTEERKGIVRDGAKL